MILSITTLSLDRLIRSCYKRKTKKKTISILCFLLIYYTKKTISILCSLSLLLFLVPLLASCTKEKQVYIVYFGEHKGDKALHEIEDHHHSYLQSVKGSQEDAKSSLLYSYKHSISGIAAKLTPDQASRLKGRTQRCCISIQERPEKV